MREVTVNTSKTYQVIIGNGILDDAGKHIRQVAGGNTAVIISDTNVGPLYSEKIANSLETWGYRTERYDFPAGEEHKTLETLGEILNFLAECKVERQDVIVALGGGVVGDVAGLAAALYMRGIKYVQVPTTILAAVDSSVGGKTAVDLKAGKNLVGAFYQPQLVFCDCQTFETLSDRDYNNGFGEVIKYGMIWDASIFSMISRRGQTDLEKLIESCVTIKKEVVEKDEFEGGLRQILNFGHTFGHAIEILSDFEIYHGEAVAIGMALMTRWAVLEGICEKECFTMLTEAIKSMDLPENCNFSASQLMEMMKLDKKARGDKINVVVPLAPGKCKIEGISFIRLQEMLRKVLL